MLGGSGLSSRWMPGYLTVWPGLKRKYKKPSSRDTEPQTHGMDMYNGVGVSVMWPVPMRYLKHTSPSVKIIASVSQRYRPSIG